MLAHESHTAIGNYAKLISRLRDTTHALGGLLYHESELEITEHYTDLDGVSEHVFALIHVLGFAFTPGSGIFMTSGSLFIKRPGGIRGFGQSHQLSP